MKKRIISMLLVLVMVLAMLPTAFADEAAEPVYGPIGENLFTNGSFETLDADGKPVGLYAWYSIVDPWGNHNGWDSKAFLETDPANVYDGSNSVHLVDTVNQWARFGMSAAIEPNKSYELSFKIKGTAGEPVGVRIVENGVENWVPAENKVTPVADEWTTLSYVYNAGNATALDFEISATWSNLDVYVDDLCLYEYGEIVVEEPETPDYLSYVTDSVDGVNWVRNNGGTFENGWDFGVWQGSEVVTGDDAFEGNAYAKLTATAEATSQIGVVAVTLPTPGVEVKVTAMVKGAAGELNLWLQHYRNDNSFIGIDSSNTVAFEASEDWQQIVFTATLPADVGGTTGGGTETYLIYHGEGTIYIDDVQFFYPKAEEEPEDPDAPVYGPIGDNLIPNGDFETVVDGKPADTSFGYSIADPWGNYDGWGVKQFLETEDVASGEYAVRMTDETNNWSRVVKQAFVEPGETYIFTLKAKGTIQNNAKLGSIIYQYKGATMVETDTGDAAIAVNPDEWTTLEYVFENGDWTILEFLICSGWNNMDIVIDDVGLYKYGEIIDQTDILDQIPDELRYPDFNGSFEELNDDGSPKNWRMAPGGFNGGTWTLTEDATDGNWAATATYPNADTHVFIDNQAMISLIPGATYRLTADIKNQASGPIGFDIQQVNSALETVKLEGGCTTDVSDEWQSASKEFVAADDAVGLYLRPGYAWNAGTVYFDNIKLEVIAVPEGYDPNAPVVPDEPAEPPVNVSGDNLIYNGSVEELDENGKPVGLSFGGISDVVTPGWGTTTTVVNDIVYDGENALQIEVPAGGGWAYAGFTAEVESEAQYLLTISGYAKTAGLTVGADYDFYDADNNHLLYSNTGKDGVTAEVNKWTTMTHLVTAPEGATKMSINVSIPWTVGTIVFDNLSLYKVTQNLVVNGSFEQLDENGQPSGMVITGASGNKFGEKVFIETNPDNVYEGSKALKIVHEETDWNCANMHAYVKPNTSYLLTYKAKGSDGLTVSADLCMWRDDSGNVSTSYIKDQGCGGDNVTIASNNWNTFQHILTTPDECGYMEIALSIPWTTGTIYYDDVSLVEMGTSFPFFAKLHLDEKIIYTGTANSYTEVYFYEAYNADENYTVDFTLTDAEGNVIDEAAGVVPTDDYATFAYTMNGLEKATQYIVTAQVKDKAGSVLETLSDDFYIYDRPTALNENMEFVNPDGSIFHPAYAYWGPETSEDYARLAAAGVNVVLWSPPGNWTIEQQLADLDLLHSLGMKANVVCFWGMLPAGHPTNRAQVSAWVEQLKDHPAIYCWSLADEPFLDTSVEMRDNMEYGYHMIRAIDPVHPITYVHCNYNHGLDEMHYFSDIILVDTYPGPYFPMESHVADKLVQAFEATDYHRPILQLIQAFTHVGSRPTPIQFHNMFYQNFLAGGQAVGWFGFGGSGRVGSGDGPMVPVEWSDDLWPVFESIYATGEYDIVFDHYSSGVEPTVAASREENVWYDVWEADGTYYAVVQNRTKSEQSVDIALPFEVEFITQISEISGEAVAVITESGITATVAPSQAYLIELVAVSDDPAPELVIITQPASYEGLVGDTVEFTVVAEGEGLTYQWFYKAVGSDEWQKSYSTGATTDTLSVELRTYRDGQQYMCVVTDANGETVESDAAAMTLKAGEFAIVSQPESYAGAEGDTVTFTVVAEGDNLTYRWKYSTDGGETWKDSWSDGYATDTLTVELKAYRNGQQYKCVVTNAKGEAIESDAASMSLKESAIEITAQPENATVAAGETVTFTVEAEGENLKYRWYRSNDGETWVETWLAGYNTNELSFVVNATRAGYAYKCVITSNGTTVETDAVSVAIG